MFIGHFAVGFAAKPAAPRTSLGTLFLAAQFLDLVWPTLVLLGIETVRIEPGITTVTPLDFVSYPVSHSLALVCLWGVLLGFAYWMVRRHAKGAVVLALCVVSHWMLDFIVHRPDLPLMPGESVKVGLGLWSSLPATVALELALFIAGLALYVRQTAARSRTGSIALWSLVAFLGATYAANLFGPPPPSVTAIGWAGQAQWLLVAWGYWIDRNRVTRLRVAETSRPAS